MYICIDCGKALTPEEFEYYEYRCEVCEKEWSEALHRWLAGEDNPELDERFNVPGKPKH